MFDGVHAGNAAGETPRLAAGQIGRKLAERFIKKERGDEVRAGVQVEAGFGVVVQVRPAVQNISIRCRSK